MIPSSCCRAAAIADDALFIWSSAMNAARHGLDLDPSIPQGPHEADLSTAPHYVCHREVMALKIVAADDSDPLCALLHFGCGAFIQVDRGWFAKNEPEAGGYFVFGLDHWAPSYVSAENFEQSFTRARSPLA